MATAGLARWLGVDSGWQNYLFQGFTNGAISEASGGDFAHGFAHGIASAYTSRQIWTGVAALEKYYSQKNAPQFDTDDPSSPPTSAPQGQPMGAAGKAQVRDAVKEANIMVDKAITDVRAVIASSTASPEYQAYFGNYDAARAQSVLTVLESVKVELQNTKLVFNSLLKSNSQYQWGKGGKDNVIAWVRQSNPHVVNLQPRWWASGLQDRAGTIIHELTHLVGGTIDHGYGSLVLTQWAQRVPMSAVNNANSYKFYALSLP